MNSLIDCDSLSFAYPGRSTCALREVSLCLPAVGRIAIFGPNGSGKTTLLLHCNGILRPSSGAVHLYGHLLHYDHLSLRSLREKVGIVFQNPEDQLFSASVAQDISFGPLNLGLHPNEAKQRVRSAAALCGVGDLLDRPTHGLSGGEKARVALAGVLAMEPQILLADEPMANLDPWMRRQVLAIFRRLVGMGRTVILATHEVELARHWAEWLVIMEGGQAIASATAAEVLANPQWVKRLGLDRPWYHEG